MKKFIFLILPAVMLMLASCMDSAGGNGGDGSVRVALPGASRDVSSSANADSYTVSLIKGGKVIESQTAVPGGAVEFNELDAGDYTVDVEATLSGALSGVGSAEVAVTEGETASCSVLMNRVYTAAQAVERIAERISDDNGEYWNIIVAGAITEDELTEITGNLKDVITNGCINLDLGRTTGLTKIETSKFKDCTALSAIVLPEGISSIYDNAFNGCKSLASVTIPDTVTAIGTSAFKDCSALASITIPNGVLAITTSAFEGCSVLKSVEIPESVTTIASGAFRDCTSLTSIEIPRGVITIGSDSFNGCTALESINIPDSVTTIERAAFHGCSSLTDVYIPDSVTEIGNQTFTNCSNLKSIVLSAGITSIAEQVFRNCTALVSIDIPDGVSEIKSNAFMSCEVLETITIPASLTSIGASAFQLCNKLKGGTVKYKGSSDDWSGITIDSNNPPFKSGSGTKIICSDDTITL